MGEGSALRVQGKGWHMRFLAILLSIFVCGCAFQSALEPPVVDQRGIDHQKFATDQAECIERGKGFVTVGAPITSCMRDRGYTILVPKS